MGRAMPTFSDHESAKIQLDDEEVKQERGLGKAATACW